MTKHTIFVSKTRDLAKSLRQAGVPRVGKPYVAGPPEMYDGKFPSVDAVVEFLKDASWPALDEAPFAVFPYYEDTAGMVTDTGETTLHAGEEIVTKIGSRVVFNPQIKVDIAGKFTITDIEEVEPQKLNYEYADSAVSKVYYTAESNRGAKNYGSVEEWKEDVANKKYLRYYQVLRKHTITDIETLRVTPPLYRVKWEQTRRARNVGWVVRVPCS